MLQRLGAQGKRDRLAALHYCYI